ncbi:hypothetical protein bsdE14_33400 [Clostridium omnivorum]|uniref:Uncharacterized protein n=1 Tax=Clostridium omnivorum TaxID=1604902 RepID=A0ABQ5NA65_9CLOT|nr:hypothetical protein bsdE14_33400 [Clostridium sp. E14]
MESEIEALFCSVFKVLFCSIIELEKFILGLIILLDDIKDVLLKTLKMLIGLLGVKGNISLSTNRSQI